MAVSRLNASTADFGNALIRESNAVMEESELTLFVVLRVLGYPSPNKHPRLQAAIMHKFGLRFARFICLRHEAKVRTGHEPGNEGL